MIVVKIALGSDPLGFELKEAVKTHLLHCGYDVLDVGTQNKDDPVLYVDASDKVARLVSAKEVPFGIVFCGTGMGVSIVANKHKGVYCALAESEWTAKQARLINNANMLALGGRILGTSMALDIVDVFLNTEWCENFAADRSEYIRGLFAKVEEVERGAFA